MQVLEPYDSDKMFPVYGFGGVIKGQSKVSHCFALNGDIYKPECNGTKGVMRAYMNALHNVELSGGTYFSHILRYINGHANS